MNNINSTFPSSVHEFTIVHLAEAFTKISKTREVLTTAFPSDFRNVKQDIKDIYFWQFRQYGSIPNIGKTNESCAKILIYCYKQLELQTKKSHVHIQNTSNNNNIIMINTLNEQINELNNQLKQNPNDQEIKQKILINKKTIEKLNNDTKSKKSDFSYEQMMAISKKVFNIFKLGNTNANLLHNEFEYLFKPKTDHLKESMGGDYILQNSTRERRYKTDNSWKNAKFEQNNKPPTSFNKTVKYVPPSVIHEEQNSVKKNVYIPPTTQSFKENIKTDDQKKKVYVPPSIERKPREETHNFPTHKKIYHDKDVDSCKEKSEYIDINKVETKKKMDLSEFPTLGGDIVKPVKKIVNSKDEWDDESKQSKEPHKPTFVELLMQNKDKPFQQIPKKQEVQNYVRRNKYEEEEDWGSDEGDSPEPTYISRKERERMKEEDDRDYYDDDDENW